MINMKKAFYYFSAVALVAMCALSCSSSDDEDEPFVSPKTTLDKPADADKAAAFEIPSNAVTSTSGESLEGFNITESGKAILKVNTDKGVKYVTYDAKIDGGTYTLYKNNVLKGTIKSTKTRSTEATQLEINIEIEIDGVTISFNTSDPVDADMVWNVISSGDNLDNIARTWIIKEITMSLKGDVDCTVTEKSGNLKVLADKAQENEAGLTDEEYKELCKTVKAITLDKTGLFSIEYDEGQSEVCSWKWGDSSQESVLLQLRDSELGNKFLNDGSKIAVKFYSTGIAHFVITTKITGTKKYDATLDITLQ
jgi:hypothetical protein